MNILLPYVEAHIFILETYAQLLLLYTRLDTDHHQLIIPPISKDCSNIFLERSFIYAAPCEGNKLSKHFRTSNFDCFRKSVDADCKRHSLQAVELSRRLQTAVQIVSKPLVGDRFTVLGKPVMRTRWITTHVWICDITLIIDNITFTATDIHSTINTHNT